MSRKWGCVGGRSCQSGVISNLLMLPPVHPEPGRLPESLLDITADWDWQPRHCIKYHWLTRTSAGHDRALPPPPTPLIHRIQIVGNKARRKIPSQKSFATVTLAPWVYFLTVWFSLCVFKWRKTTLDLSAVIENLLDPLMGWWVEPDEFSRKSEGIPGAELQRVKV